MRSAIAGALLAVAALCARAAELEDAAERAAAAWIAHVDGGEYAASWREAAAAFRGAITAAQWTDAAARARDPLGALGGRKLLTAVHTTELPGVPKDDYVVVNYESSFANDASVIETITMVREEGVWRAIGYFMR
jgi:hypothetical protein